MVGKGRHSDIPFKLRRKNCTNRRSHTHSPFFLSSLVVICFHTCSSCFFARGHHSAAQSSSAWYQVRIARARISTESPTFTAVVWLGISLCLGAVIVPSFNQYETHPGRTLPVSLRFEPARLSVPGPCVLCFQGSVVGL